ncbi:hypothetical protein PV328_004032 [Microctonus aethiopoides]|uniref:Uncharacterized protein n=1 Tax=Microctonus aethiopoides TaxID=144406 RepID=A0AA39F9Q6_9HYME|nr:hypothetical protein PV328_004032 [Microctonus aethiopoides]
MDNNLNNKKSVAKYALVEFIEEKTSDGKISIEYVPSSWVNFDHEIGKCSVKFLAQPYGPENIRMINDLIKKCAPTPQTSYSEACKKIKVLETQAFTTDSETRDSEYITHKNRQGKKIRFEVMSKHHSKDRNNNFGVIGNSKQKSAINSSSNSEDSAGVGIVSTLSNRNIVISTDPNITAKSDQNHNINREEKGVEDKFGVSLCRDKKVERASWNDGPKPRTNDKCT